MTAAAPPPVVEAGPKGLRPGALGLWGNTVIGLGATAPAYSLAATLGYVVLAVGEKAPAMFLVAFVPMLFVAVAYRELNRAVPDCGTTFTWGTKAFGPWVGWMGGWGVAVSAIIVLANVAEIAAVYTLRALGFVAAAENTLVKVGVGVLFILVMTWVSHRGIVLSERFQNALIVFQIVVLAVLAAGALWLVYSGDAGPQAVLPSWSWFDPTGISGSAAAQALILCIFVYWGWDACLAVGEETRGSTSTPGRAALLATVILLAIYVVVAVALQSYAGFGDTGIGLANPEHSEDVLTLLGAPMGGTPEAAQMMYLMGALARKYKLPWRTSGFHVGSKLNDAQAGYEANMLMHAAILAGANYIWHSAGWLEAGLTCGYSKFATDCEQLVGWYKYAGGVSFDDFKEAMAAIREVGPQGHFLGTQHTLEHFERAFFMPSIMDFNSFEQWSAEGAKDHDTRGIEKARNMLADYQEPKLDEGIADGLKDLIAQREEKLPDSIS